MAMTRESVHTHITKMKADTAQARATYDAHVAECARCQAGPRCTFGAFRYREWLNERGDLAVYVQRAVRYVHY